MLRQLGLSVCCTILFCACHSGENSGPGSPSTDAPIYTYGSGGGSVEWKTISPKAPEQIKGLTLLFRADKGLKVAEHSLTKAISSWTDQGPNKLTLEPGSGQGNLPKLGSIGSNPAVAFDGVNPGLKSAPVLGSKLIKPDATSLFIVESPDASFPNNDAFGWGQCTTERFNTQLAAGGTLFFHMGNIETGALSSHAPADWNGKPHVISIVRGGGDARMSTDGALLRAASKMKVSLKTAIEAPLVVGDMCLSGFKGKIAEIVLYNVALSQKEEQQAVKYLAQKYGIGLK